MLTEQKSAKTKKNELPAPFEESKKDYPQPSVLDISRFIKSYLPMGLHGVDKDGNLQAKSEKSQSSDDEIHLLGAEKDEPMGMMDVHVFKMKGGFWLD